MDMIDQRITALETSRAALSSLATKLVSTLMRAAQTSELDAHTRALEVEIAELRTSLAAQPGAPTTETVTRPHMTTRGRKTSTDGTTPRKKS